MTFHRDLKELATVVLDEVYVDPERGMQAAMAQGRSTKIISMIK
jgi:hypothetical protein